MKALGAESYDLRIHSNTASAICQVKLLTDRISGDIIREKMKGVRSMAGHGGRTQTDEQYAMPRHGRYSDSKLAQIRMSKGMTQRQLADMIGAQHSTINKMEKLDSLSVKQAMKVAPALGIDWRELVDD